MDCQSAFDASALRASKTLLRPKQVMQRLGVKATKFRLLVKSGALDVRKLGRATVVTEESLGAFIDSLPKVAAPISSLQQVSRKS